MATGNLEFSLTRISDGGSASVDPEVDYPKEEAGAEDIEILAKEMRPGRVGREDTTLRSARPLVIGVELA